jgi:hypothetical protein
LVVGPYLLIVFVDCWLNLIITALRFTRYGKMSGMARKKKRKPKRFRAVEAVKALAREQIGAPPPSQVVPDRRQRKVEKHKPTLGKLLEET